MPPGYGGLRPGGTKYDILPQGSGTLRHKESPQVTEQNKNMTDNIGNYEERKFPEYRIPTVDTLRWGRRKHHIPCLLEIDITDAREKMRAFKTESHERFSFTGWVVKCIGQAASEHKQVHAMRRGKRKLVIFDDVDIAIIVEKPVEDNENNRETLPMPYVIRKANEKSLKEIDSEIRQAQKELPESGEVQLNTTRNARQTRIFSRMPRFIRDLLVWRRISKNPFLAKKMMGTVAVTSLVNVSSSGATWAIPTGIHPLVFALGGIVKKPGLADGEIKVREYLSMTVLFDHDVIDGAPVARFLNRLRDLLEQGYGVGE
jgi:pyruvate/2-oxoglutarate dehydrogenase complex dihydrolipoamide acyltransferase (E2) component